MPCFAVVGLSRIIAMSSLVSPLLFSAASLDRRHDLRDQPSALDAFWQDDRTRLLLMRGEDGLVDAQGCALISGGEALALRQQAVITVFLGVTPQGGAVFAADLPLDGDDPALAAPGRQWMGLRTAALRLPFDHAGLAAYARGLVLWHRRARFCGWCGAATLPGEGGHMRRCTNPQCGQPHYPRTDPAVIMAVEDDLGRILLSRQASWPKGQWSVLAGFIEPGETPEQAVIREVHEETGIAAGQVRYAGSQPWPFPSSLMMGFFARAEGGELRPDHAELEDARWFSRDDIATLFDDRHRDNGAGLFLSTPVSISRRLIESWFSLGGAPAP